MINYHLILSELSLNEDDDGLQNGLTTVKLDLQGFEKAREADGEEISWTLVPVRIILGVKVVKLVDKLRQGEHHFSQFLIVDVGIHCSDDEEKEKSDLVRWVKAVDDKVANPDKKFGVNRWNSKVNLT